MPTKSKTKYALLGILSLYPMSGYDLKKFCDKVVAQFWNENYAHIYPELKELEKEGLAVKKAEQTGGRPVKYIYYITEKGRNELKEWLLIPAKIPRRRFEFILKLFFSADVPVEKLIANVKRFKEEHEEILEKLIQSEKEIEQTKTEEPRRAKLWLITVNAGEYDSMAMIKWCDETLETLETMKEQQTTP
jgi:PadR family transcriptional regulator, regulatory protein AphA